MKDFRKIQVWQKAHELTLAAYEATSSFPREEMYGLTSQIRRAATSVPTNIAEGCGRGTVKELSHFCQIAMGSASELEYQFLLAKDLGFIDEVTYESLDAKVTEVKKMLSRFIVALRR